MAAALGTISGRNDRSVIMDEEKNTYNVDVVVTITLQAESRSVAYNRARAIVNENLRGHKNNDLYPDCIRVKKLSY